MLEIYITATETTCTNKYETALDSQSFGTYPFAGSFSLFSAVPPSLPGVRLLSLTLPSPRYPLSPLKSQFLALF